MNEKAKIRMLLEEYKEFIAKTDYDVCESVKGEWFFFCYDKEHDLYHSFYKFSSAENLERIIIGEVLDSINIAVECTAEEITFAHGKGMKFVDVEVTDSEYNLVQVIEDFRISAKAINKIIHLIQEAFRLTESINPKASN